MYRPAVSVFFAIVSSPVLHGQQPPPPPAPPVEQAPAPAVAPPLPGQLQTAPAPALTPLPPLPPLPTAVPSVPIAKAQPGSSTSTTGQFIVHGDDLKLRSALSSKCEDYANELRNLLRDKQPWKLPVIVLVNSGTQAKKPGKPVSTSISQLTQGGFHIQVNVNMRPDLNPDDVRSELVRALLAERILRDQREIVSKRSLLLPDWLFVGVLEALDYRKRARPSALFAAIFKSGKIFGIEEIIEASADDVDDALSKTIYQTSCCALVLALLDQPDAGLRMDKFLHSLAGDARSERELLNQWFPNFASSEASLNKWWALQLATLASPTVGEPLSPQDTLAALEDALVFRFQAAPGEAPQPSRKTPPTPRPAPQRSPVLAAAERTPAPAADGSKDDAATEPAKADTEDKPGFMSRLNPFSRRRTSDDDIAAAIEEAAKEEADSQKTDVPADRDSPPSPAPATQASATDLPPGPDQAPAGERTPPGTRKPLFNRLFGEDGADKDKEKPPVADEPAAPEMQAPKEAPKANAPARKAAPAPAPTPAATPKAPAPAAEPASETKPEADKKPSGLNPLNWFRGGKKDKGEAEPAEQATPPADKETPPKESATHLPPAEGDPLMTALLGQGKATFLMMQQVAAETPPAEADTAKNEEGEKRGFLGLFGRKKTAKESAEPEAPATPPAPAKEDKKATPAPPAPAKDKDKQEAAEKAETAANPPAEAPATGAEMSAEDPKDEEKEKAVRRPLRLRLFGADKKEEMAEEPEADKPQEPQVAAKEEKETKPARSKPKPKPPAPAAAPEQPATVAAPQPVPVPVPAPAPVPVTPARPTAPPAKDGRSVMAAVPIEDYALILKRKDFDKITERNALALTALQNRASILFRPIVTDYLQALADLQKGKTRGMDARLRTLRNRMDEALARSNAVRDLLDVHEANASPAMSGLFSDYLDLPETIENELPPREDPISKYLDALDKEFSED